MRGQVGRQGRGQGGRLSGGPKIIFPGNLLIFGLTQNLGGPVDSISHSKRPSTNPSARGGTFLTLAQI